MRKAAIGAGILLLTCISGTVSAATSVPRDFTPVVQQRGVNLYRRGIHTLQVIDSEKGAHLELAAGEVVQWQAFLVLQKRTMNDWWDAMRKKNTALVSTSNGQFFDPRRADGAPIAFSTKIAGTIIEGYADKTEAIGKKKVFMTDGRNHDIVAYKDDPVSLATMPKNAIVGLSPLADKDATKRKGRTFLATDGRHRIFLFHSPAATQRFATRLLQHIGAPPQKILMLDGGGSASLMVNGETWLPSKKNGDEPYARSVPNILAVIAGTDRRPTSSCAHPVCAREQLRAQLD